MPRHSPSPRPIASPIHRKPPCSSKPYSKTSVKRAAVPLCVASPPSPAPITCPCRCRKSAARCPALSRPGADWAPQAEAVFVAVERLKDKLSDRHGTPEDFAARALASAILLGGLLRPDAWPAFWRELHSNISFGRSKQIGDLVWLDLTIPRKQRRAAQDAAFETLRLFPDTVTLSLIVRAKGAQITPEISPAQLLRHAMRAIAADDLELTPETIRHAGFAAIEDASPYPIPAVLFEVARGALPAFSAASDTWRGMLGAPMATRIPATKDRDPAVAPVVPIAISLDVEQSLDRLSAAVMARNPMAQKQTRAPVVAALQHLLAGGPVPVVRGICLWMLDLLARRRAPGTIRRYGPALARTLCGRFGANDPASMPAAQIEVLISDALDLVPRAERIYRAARLAQLFDFASGDHRLGWPQVDLDVEGGAIPRVRTALISPQQLARAIKAFSHDPVGQAAVLLAARGGLRLSDMEALRLGDVEPGPDGMVRIHHTLWGDLKTSSARRMVPLASLLTPDESRIWDRFLSLRRSEATSPDAPLLATGGGLLPVIRFNRSAFATSLARATGHRPHDLRHGALSNLALLLLAPEADSDTIHNLTGWRARQCSALRDRLIARDPWRGMNELARLAGHRDPATTLESYVVRSEQPFRRRLWSGCGDFPAGGSRRASEGIGTKAP